MKKKILIIAAIIAVLVSVACLSASAAEVASGTCGADGDNLTWTLDSNGLLTISGTGAMGDWTSSLSVPWNEYKNAINTVVIEDGVTSIGENAFNNCISLTSVTIDNSVTSIGGWAFSKCRSLTSVIIPDSVTSIGDYAFDYCSSLTSVTVGNGVTSIGDWSFFCCSSLTSITIGKGLTSIGNYAFYNCASLEYIYIPDKVTNIGDYAFCSCKSLKNIILHNGLLNIGDAAFWKCDALVSINIPNSVTNIGSAAFFFCSSLTDINVDEKNENYISIDGVLFDKNKTTLISYPANKETLVYNVPDGVINIGEYAFGEAKLTTINIPDSVINIGGFAFAYSSLRSIIIPDGVTTLYDETFSQCKSLISVTVSDNINTIEGRAFYCSYNLEVIKYKGEEDTWDSITKGDDWDYDAGKFTAKGTYLVVFGDEAVTLYNGVCGNNLTWTLNSELTLNISGTGAMDDWTFSSKVPWNECEKAISTVVIENGVTSIGKYAFSGCSSLANVTIGNSITSIGYSAFSRCSSLTNVTIPARVIRIDSTAFSGCTSLETIIYEGTEYTWSLINKGPEWDKNVGNSTAEGKYSMMFENKVVTIASGTCGEHLTWTLNSELALNISGTGAMDDWKFSSSVPWGVYIKATNTVVIEDGVTSINDYAFNGCTSLTGATIPVSVTSVGFSAFNGCTSLEVITYEGTEIAWGAITNSSKWDQDAGKDTASGTYTMLFGNKYVMLASGVCGADGDNLTWTLDSNGLLTISGTGAMGGWTSSSSVPWNEYKIAINTVVIEDGVTSINDYAFYGCTSLTSVSIPDSITSLGNSAFRGCTSLTGMTLPNSVTSINDYAFYGCTSLTSVSIPDSITSIGNYAFGYCSSLTSVTIGNGVTSINKNVFNGCTSLTSVTIPVSVTSIGFSAFNGCTLLEVITYEGTEIAWGAITKSSKWDQDAGRDTASGVYTMLFGNKYVMLASGVCGADGDNLTWTLDSNGLLTISGTGAMIDMMSWQSCPWNEYKSSINTLVIEDGVTSIGIDAFYGCASLTSATIPVSVTSVGFSAFNGCTSLEVITYEGTEIAWGAITNSSNWDQNAGKDTASGTYTMLFGNKYVMLASGVCGADGDNLTWTLDSNGVLTISGEGKMRYGKYNATGSYSVSSSDVPWYSYLTGIKTCVIENGVTHIESFALRNCNLLTSVTIPASVTSIGMDVFENCSSLPEIKVDINNPNYTSVNGILFDKNKTELICYPAGNIAKAYDIPDSVTSIGRYAFDECTSLTSITIPDSVTSIGNCAFCGCSSLAEIKVDTNNSNYSSVNGILLDKNKTELICYPAGNTSISYVIPTSVSSIGKYAFSGCASLTSIIIPASVASMGMYAFFDCGNLETITYIGTEEKWNAITKGNYWDRNVGKDTTNATYTLVFAPPAITYGDATGDGNVDGKDLVRIKKYIAGYDFDTGISDVDIEAGADANGDGIIDNKDLVRLKKYIAAYDYDTGTSDVLLGPTA